MALEEEAALELQDQEIASVLDYWFEEVDQKDWFVQSDAVDAQIIERFAGLHKRAANAELSTWADTADGSLALLILLDQFSRNMYRGDAKSFATDALARDIANAAIRDDHDLLCAKNAQNFYYLPFMHSEDLDDQDRGIALTLERAKPMDNALHARAHRAIIAKFGRFPFRNAAMGRETTPEEQQFLDEGGYGQIVKQVQSETAG
nr:DUF924 family protein [Amylibacter marinus]